MITHVSVEDIFGRPKPIIGMVHFWIPSPSFRVEEPTLSFFEFTSNVRKDINALQIGGVDGLLFVNESDKPVRDKVDYDVYSWLSLVMGSILDSIQIPFGIEVLDDPIAGLNLATILGAEYVRGSFLEGTSSYKDAKNASPKKREAPQSGKHQLGIYGNQIWEESSDTDSKINNEKIKNKIPDHVTGISLSGFSSSDFANVYSHFKTLNPTKDLIIGGGVNHKNAKNFNNCSDGMIVGSSFKRDGLITNEVEVNRVKDLVTSVRK